MRNRPFDADEPASDLRESVFFQPAKPAGDKTIRRLADQLSNPRGKKYTTYLPPATILTIRHYALEHSMKAYEVVQQALDDYFEHHEGQH